MRSREGSGISLPPELELEDISMTLTDDKGQSTGRSMDTAEEEEEEQVRTVRVRVRGERCGWGVLSLSQESFLADSILIADLRTFSRAWVLRRRGAASSRVDLVQKLSLRWIRTAENQADCCAQAYDVSVCDNTMTAPWT